MKTTKKLPKNHAKTFGPQTEITTYKKYLEESWELLRELGNLKDVENILNEFDEIIRKYDLKAGNAINFTGNDETVLDKIIHSPMQRFDNNKFRQLDTNLRSAFSALEPRIQGNAELTELSNKIWEHILLHSSWRECLDKFNRIHSTLRGLKILQEGRKDISFLLGYCKNFAMDTTTQSKYVNDNVIKGEPLCINCRYVQLISACGLRCTRAVFDDDKFYCKFVVHPAIFKRCVYGVGDNKPDDFQSLDKCEKCKYFVGEDYEKSQGHFNHLWCVYEK